LVWPEDQQDVTIASRDITPRTYAILERMGEGHPAKILKRAYEMSEQDVLDILRQGQESRRREDEGI
jgi:Mor family transcriptional regulator